jgi:hypothetical protein
VHTSIKKITSLLLILLVLLPSLFIFFVAAQREKIRHSMKEKMEEHLLHSITIQNDDIVWVKPGKEIRIGEQMFDIKHINRGEHTTTFLGLYDEEETMLNKQVRDGWNKNTNKQSLLLSHLVQFLYSFYFIPQAEVDPIVYIENKFNNPAPPLLSAGYTSVSTPPPLNC